MPCYVACLWQGLPLFFILPDKKKRCRLKRIYISTVLPTDPRYKTNAFALKMQIYGAILAFEVVFAMQKELSIELREWRLKDAPGLTVAINNKNVLDNLRDGIPFPYTEKDAAEFIIAMLNAEKDSQYAFAITYDGKVIGSIGVFRKDNVHRFTAELGYYIAEPYWGKGIMSEAVQQMIAFIFENTDIIRIFAEPYAYNTASCRVLEKAGFQFEGLLRKNAIKNGQMQDMSMYAIIKPEV